MVAAEPRCDGVDCSDYEPAAAETDDCNVRKCNSETGLCERVLVPAATVCDDGLFCTVNDVCDGAGSCTGETLSCSDNVDCTSDMCDEETDSCTHQITIGGCREAACTPGADADSDGTDDCVDNCPGVTNRAQGDADGDGIGNACEACNDPRFDYTNDGDVDDGDRVVFENCMRSDGQYGMAIDVCACSDITYDDHVDAEDLGWFIACYVTGGAADPSCDDLDHCPADPYKAAPRACGCGVADTDSDGDALPDCEDTCTDTDGDTFGNPGFTISGCAGSTTVPDNCPDIANPPPTFDPTHQGDIDGDDIGNACEACNDPRFDVTGDHIVTVLDHNYWQTCFNGPNQPYALSAIDRDACACMDADHDDDLDGADYLRFQSCLDPGDDPTCDD